MDKRFRQQLLLVAFGVLLFTALNHLNYVASFLTHCAEMISPALTGLLLAFVLSIPMQGIAKRLARQFPKWNEKRVDLVSLTLTLLIVAAVIALVCVMAIPQLTSSVKSAVELVKVQWPGWAAELQSYGIDTSAVTDWLSELDWKTALSQALSGAGVVIGSVVSFAGSTVSRLVNAGVALVIMFYVLAGRRELGRQTTRLLQAYCRPAAAQRLIHIARAAHDTYARFLSGQCVEVLILGSMIFVAFSLFGIPYAALTAVLTAVMAFVPYIGAFVSCAVGVVLTLLAEPEKALLCFLVYEVMQFVENQFIYPHVVGGSVGLSPFWTLLAVLVGGQLFGVVGIIFFIPFMALLSQLLHEHMDARLADRAAQEPEPDTST